MYKIPPIIYDDSVIHSIIIEIVNKTPGFNTSKNPKINISSDKSEITVEVSPLHSINNVLNAAYTLQTNIVNTLRKNMDINPKHVNIYVIGNEND